MHYQRRLFVSKLLSLHFLKVNFGFLNTFLNTASSAALYQKCNLCIPGKGFARPSPNSYIHVSVRDLYVPRIGPHIWLQKNKQPDPGNI
jgi:hypothetical protein